MLFKVAFDKEIHILKSNNAHNLLALKQLVPKVFKCYPSNFYLTYLDEDNDEITLANEGDYSILVGGGAKSAKILIKEKNEDFYDQTQKIQLPEEEEVIIEKDSIFNDASEIKSNYPQDISIDESIEEKLKIMLPDLISKIKTEVQEEMMSQSKMLEASKQADSTMEEPKNKVTHRHIICDDCGVENMMGVRYKCAVCNDFDICEKCEVKSEHPHPFLKIKHPRQRPMKIAVVLYDEEDSVEVNGQRHQMEGLSELVENGMNFIEQYLQSCKIRYPEPQQPKNEEPKKEEPKKEEPKIEEPKIEEPKKEEPKKEQPKNILLPTKAFKMMPGFKFAPTIQQKVSAKVENVEQKVEVKEEPKKVEQIEQKQEEQNTIEKANYLANVLDLDFTKAFKFAQKHPLVTKEAVLDMYLRR